MSGELERRFDRAMLEIYQRAKREVGYNATRFLQMLNEHRGVETARILLHAPQVSEGYVALWERGRLDLTVEALVVTLEFSSLFTPLELEIAHGRLAEYRNAPKPGEQHHAEDVAGRGAPTQPAPMSGPSAASYRDQVGRGLAVIGDALLPYVRRELDRVGRLDEKLSPDPHPLLRLMKTQWEIFDSRLGRTGRNCVYGLLDVRNSWAHHEPFTADDAHSALHTMTKLLKMIEADEAAARVAQMRDELKWTDG